MADMPDYVSHGAMSRVDQVSVVKLTHKYDFVTCFVKPYKQFVTHVSSPFK